MATIELPEVKLIGLALKTKTSNKDGQSGRDCGQLWQRFEQEKYYDKIPNKLGNDILAVYHDYEGDYMQPFSYFIGCKVPIDTPVPEGLDSVIIPQGAFQKIVAKGQMPDCIGAAWIKIWNANLPRAYKADFEVYDERCADWSNAEVDIYVSVDQ